MAEPEPAAPVTKICSTCAAFVVSGAADGEHDGWCHHNPPQVMATAPVAGETRMNPQFFWPEVMNDDWCLQWAAKP
jgi:hypothetical protein